MKKLVLNSISYYKILGLPVLAYGGIFTLICLLTTATLGYLSTQGKPVFKWHRIMAAVTVVFALMHGTLGILVYL